MPKRKTEKPKIDAQPVKVPAKLQGKTYGKSVAARNLGYIAPPVKEIPKADDPPATNDDDRTVHKVDPATPHYLLEDKSPADVINMRYDYVMAMASTTHKQIIQEIVEALALNPDTPIYMYDFNSLPADVLAVVLNALACKGWDCHYDGGTKIQIVLPLCPVLAAINQTQRSVVKPL